MLVESGSLVDTYDEASMSWTEDIGVFLKKIYFKSVNTSINKDRVFDEKVEWKESQFIMWEETRDVS